jgi:hypothetical protein
MFSSSQLPTRARHRRRRAHALGVAAELLAERDRHGVLQVRAAGLQHVGELVGLARSSRQRVRRGDERRGAEQQREPRRGGKTSLVDCPC